MPLFIFVRHGQSEWNLENRFTGEVDVGLTGKGRKEAREAGEKLKGMPVDRCYTSALKRAQQTLEIILEVTGRETVPVIKDRALNERNYGRLQGLNKAKTVEKFGEAQVMAWRRSYAVAPPGGESLKDTAARVIPYYEKEIRPWLLQGENILVAAHGNSLRALMMHLEKISPENIVTREIPTGVPRVYTMDAELNILRVAYL